MAKKTASKKQAKTKSVKPMAKQKPMKAKVKIPSLGGSLTGLGGTGAQGSMY